MLINFSNHPSASWDERQSSAAMEYGTVVDLPFPSVDSTEDEQYIQALTDTYLEKIVAIAGTPENATIHIMGEMTLTFALVKALQAKGFRCIASTTDRVVTILPDGTKNVSFSFSRFREYL